MIAADELKQMTTPDMLRLMEALWENLSERNASLISPDWHGEVLAERDRLIESGEEKFLDWEATKKKLRDALHAGLQEN